MPPMLRMKLPLVSLLLVGSPAAVRGASGPAVLLARARRPPA
jgi:hypothetical protein